MVDEAAPTGAEVAAENLVEAEALVVERWEVATEEAEVVPAVAEVAAVVVPDMAVDMEGTAAMVEGTGVAMNLMVVLTKVLGDTGNPKCLTKGTATAACTPLRAVTLLLGPTLPVECTLFRSLGTNTDKDILQGTDKVHQRNTLHLLQVLRLRLPRLPAALTNRILQIPLPMETVWWSNLLPIYNSHVCLTCATLFLDWNRYGSGPLSNGNARSDEQKGKIKVQKDWPHINIKIYFQIPQERSVATVTDKELQRIVQ